MAISLTSVVANEIYGVRSPLPLSFISTSIGETFQTIVIDLKIWIGNKTTAKPATVTYNLSMGQGVLAEDLQYYEVDIAELVREYIDTNEFSYPSNYTNDWAAWVEVDWTATTENEEDSDTFTIICTNGFRPYEQDTLPLSSYYFPAEVRVPDDHSYFITALDKGVTGGEREVDTIEIIYDTSATTVDSFGTAGATSSSLFKTATLTWGANDTEATVKLKRIEKYKELVEAAGGTIDSQACVAATFDELGYEAEAEFKVKKYCKAKYENVMIGYVNRIGAIDYQYFFGRTDKSQSVERELYRPALDNRYKNSSSQYRVLSANGRLPFTTNTDWVSQDTKEKIRDLILTEYAFEAQGTITAEKVKALNPTDSEQNMKVDDNELINYTLSFEYAYDYINSVR